MMRYPKGEIIKVGDLVWFNEGINVGRVSNLVESNSEIREWGVEEPGIFFCFDLSGKALTNDVFNSEDMLADEGVGLLNEAEERLIRQLRVIIIEHEAEVSEFECWSVRTCPMPSEVEGYDPFWIVTLFDEKSRNSFIFEKNLGNYTKLVEDGIG